MNEQKNKDEDKSLVSKVPPRDRLVIAFATVVFGSVSTLASVWVTSRPSTRTECNSKIEVSSNNSTVNCANVNAK